jgi:two-component system sensor histidine kinase MprB
MSLRTRIAVIAAAAVAVSVLAVSLGLYVATARTLHGAVDRSLGELAHQALRRPEPGPRGGPRPQGPMGPARLGMLDAVTQMIAPDGRVRGRGDAVTLPVSDGALAIARLGSGHLFETMTVDGMAVRVLTVPAGRGGALQFARPTQEIDESLARLRRTLALGGLGGVLLATLLGMVVAQRAVRPVLDLTEVAEDVAATGDLTRRIAVQGGDEIGRLAHTFNGMLANLEQARLAQEQLVADASHELRTPLTSLRTNIEVLAQADRLAPAARRALIRDVVGQLDEFGRLVSGLVELGRGARPAQAVTAVRLDEVVEQAAASARIFAPDAVRIDVSAQPTVVRGERDRLEQAVANLIDNAVKYGGGGPVEVSVADGRVVVRDHGPGIAAEHLGRVFERFYRAPEARSAPGSGLGLSIVRQTAEAHGGSVSVENAEGGGARFTLRLPTAAGV